MNLHNSIFLPLIILEDGIYYKINKKKKTSLFYLHQHALYYNKMNMSKRPVNIAKTRDYMLYQTIKAQNS